MCVFTFAPCWLRLSWRRVAAGFVVRFKAQDFRGFFHVYVGLLLSRRAGCVCPGAGWRPGLLCVSKHKTITDVCLHLFVVVFFLWRRVGCVFQAPGRVAAVFFCLFKSTTLSRMFLHLLVIIIYNELNHLVIVCWL